MKSHDNLSLTKLSFGDITLFTISSDLTRQLLFYSETNTILTIGWIHQLQEKFTDFQEESQTGLFSNKSPLAREKKESFK